MKSCRPTLALLFCLGIFSSSARGNEIFKIDPARSTITFKTRHFLGTAKGRFTKFSGTIEVDREQPEKSSVTAAIQAASIDTANAKRDQHLRTADFFDVTKFPEITFKTRLVKQTGPDSGEIAGDLTMHGVTRPITLRVQLIDDPGEMRRSERTRWRVTAGALKRSEFRLGSGRGFAASMIGDDVSIEMEIEARR